jgi:uncharacterized membrane protein
MQTPSPVATGFLAQIMPYLVSFLALVIPALGAWIVSALNANHKVAVDAAAAANTAAASVAAHAQASSLKLDSIEGKVNGAMTALQDKSDAADAQVLAAKDAQIAALQANKNV